MKQPDYKNYIGILKCEREPVDGFYECTFCDTKIPEDKLEFVSCIGNPYCNVRCLEAHDFYERHVENPD